MGTPAEIAWTTPSASWFGDGDGGRRGHGHTRLYEPGAGARPARGSPCDIFSFGVILHELPGGKRAFQGETSINTMQAILRQDAPALPETVPAALRQIVAHCLEKNAGERFQSAHDLRFALSQSSIQSPVRRRGGAPASTGRSLGDRRRGAGGVGGAGFRSLPRDACGWQGDHRRHSTAQ